jgi:hypothetical protein
MRLTTLALPAVAALIAACSSQQVADFNQAIKPKSAAGQPTQTPTAAPAPAPGSAARGFEPTAEQVQVLKRHIATGASDAAMTQARQEAAVHIERAVMGMACAPKTVGYPVMGFMETMKAPNGSIDTTFGAPRQSMRYDTGGQCLDVVRLDAWSMPARNALTFRAVFASKASGEGASKTYQMVKQPEGAWLFTAAN